MYYQNKVSLVLIGDDYELARWIKTIVLFMEELPISSIKKLEIFLVPTKKFNCSIAEYISKKDLWYKRFVYDVFR